MSGSVIRNAIVDLRRMALRSAKRRRPPPSIGSASTAASTMLTLLMVSRAQRSTKWCAADPGPPRTLAVPDQRCTASRRFALHRIRDTWNAAAGALNPVKEPAAARGGAAIRRVGGRQHREHSGPHEAFDLALGPGEGLFQRLALHEPHHHLGLDRLRINLDSDLGRSGLRRDRE